jgi:hypothetical protein
MDDIIIIILTLAFAIVAAINQSKNKKRAEQSGQERTPDFPEGFFGEKRIEPGSRPAPSRHAETFPPLQSLKRTTIPRENRTSFATHEEGVRNEIIAGVAARKSDETPEPHEPDLLERFSLKDAVISTEILHPKYF